MIVSYNQPAISPEQRACLVHPTRRKPCHLCVRRIGFVKPEPEAYGFVRRLAGERAIRYIDDNPVNVAAAGAVFDEALGLDQVDRLRGTPAG
jgi:hypothetical protein